MYGSMLGRGGGTAPSSLESPFAQRVSGYTGWRLCVPDPGNNFDEEGHALRLGNSGLTRYLTLSAIVAATITLTLGALPLAAGEGGIAGARYTATLVGAEENPPITTGASGEFELTVVDGGTWLYTLSYRNLEGGDPTAAHIHVGPRGANGPVVIFLCGGGGKPPCPAAGSVSGTITAADVMDQAAAGVTAGNVGAVLAAMQAGNTYANVHNAQNPGGQIRGQIS
jgi:CHRD domain